MNKKNAVYLKYPKITDTEHLASSELSENMLFFSIQEDILGNITAWTQ